MQLCTYLELAGLPVSVSRAHKLLSGLHHSPGLHPCCTERHNFFSSNKGPVGWQYLSSKRLCMGQLLEWNRPMLSSHKSRSVSTISL